MSGAFPSEVVRVVVATLTPFITVFGLYVIAHGHYGPGGGFAGGVIVAVAAILCRLTLDHDRVERRLPTLIGPVAGGLGILVFLACALVPLALGGALLDYEALALPGMEPARARYLGILIVEAGVGLAVFGAMMLIYDVLAERTR